mgnify:FL=1
MTTPWYDVEMRGRRLEAIAKQMNTKYWNLKDENPELAFSYFDRLLRLESTIQPYIEQITGVKKFIKQRSKAIEADIPR